MENFDWCVLFFTNEDNPTPGLMTLALLKIFAVGRKEKNEKSESKLVGNLSHIWSQILNKPVT